jgi:formate hydrogenlyase subunit 4
MSLVAVFVNVLLFLLLAPLFDGVMRKITARVQSRQGPPVVQPYYDLLKLLGKERVVSARTWAFKLAPPAAFASILAVAALVPLGSKVNALAGRVDVLTLVYLLTLGGVSVLLGALASRNTFAAIGASREMVTMVMVEPVLAMTLILGAVRGHSLGLGAAVFSTSALGYGVSTAVMLVAYLAALQAFVAKQPFDIAEAEIEVLEGPFIEYSGPDYALFRYYMMMKQMVYAWLFAAVFLPFLRTGTYAGDILTQLLGTLLVFAVIALVGSTNPRLRIDQAVKIYAGLIVIALVAVGLAVAGI